MPTQSWRAIDIKGLTPAIDMRRSTDLFALGGRNYVFDSRGPKSIFGDRLLLPHPLGNAAHVQSVRLRLRSGDRVFVFEANSILEWSELKGSWKVIYVTPDTTLQPYRWTAGYLNGKLYFCHPRVGLLVLDIASQICGPHKGAGVSTAPLAICVDNGRLIVIDNDYAYWSNQSDGLDFEPKLGGAGFQQISDRVAGFPTMVTSYAKGFLTWTTGGVMRSEFTGDAAVYRHRNINTEYRMINSFCSTQIDDNTCIILDERGLFQSQGEAPTPYAPLFNEFLLKYIQANNLRIGQNVRIEWDDLQRLMFVSVSLSQNNPVYEKAFVLYPPIDKWGIFGDSHFGILPLRIENSSREDDYFGFVDDQKRVRYWRETGSREALPNGLVNLYYPPTQKPIQLAENFSGAISSSSMIFNSWNDSVALEPAGYYLPSATVRAPATLKPLDAELQIGLIRFEDLRDSNDQITEVTQVFMGNVLSGPKDVLGLDFNLVPPGTSNEDYATGTGQEDYGLDRLNYVNHKIELIGSNDGSSKFYSEIPQLESFTTAGRNYSCSVPAVWHILKISATEIGESFHLNAFELTAAYAGKLM